MISNFKMGYYHQKDCIRPYQTSDKIKKPMGFEYTSLISTKTYSILSYIVGGFVGSKSQMNNHKHLSYDLNTVIFNLLNPQRTGNRLKDNIYCNKLNYDKYYQKSNYKEQTVDLELDIIGAFSLLEQNMLNFNGYCDKFSESQTELKVTRPEIVADKTGAETMLCANYLANRPRQQSESSVESTDSESFIVFDDQYNEEMETDEEEEEEKEEEEEEEEDDDDDDDDDDDEDEANDGANDEEDCSRDEHDVGWVKEVAEANEKWSKNYEDVAEAEEMSRKVRFSEEVKINKMVAWDHAYRAARPGPWEQMARDRVRFRERIRRTSSVICPVLERGHRERIYKELYS